VVVERVATALNEAERSVKGSRVLVLGVAYKRDIDDVRESPALDIIALLRERGAEVSYHDPFIPSIRLGEDDHGAAPADAPRLSSVPFDKLDGYDAVVVVTDHSTFDYPRLAREARLVVDTRNATRRVREGAKARIVTI
jgi:UDP-N-acetyl-D-glucosamine dehydrogenase